MVSAVMMTGGGCGSKVGSCSDHIWVLVVVYTLWLWRQQLGMVDTLYEGGENSSDGGSVRLTLITVVKTVWCFHGNFQ